MLLIISLSVVGMLVKKQLGDIYCLIKYILKISLPYYIRFHQNSLFDY